MHEEFSLVKRLLNIIGWIVGVTVTLVVSSALINHTLIAPYLTDSASAIAGWALIVLTAIGVVVALATRTVHKR